MEEEHSKIKRENETLKRKNTVCFDCRDKQRQLELMNLFIENYDVRENLLSVELVDAKERLKKATSNVEFLIDAQPNCICESGENVHEKAFAQVMDAVCRKVSKNQKSSSDSEMDNGICEKSL